MYIDANYGSDIAARRYTTSGLVLLGGLPIIHKSKNHGERHTLAAMVMTRCVRHQSHAKYTNFAQDEAKCGDVDRADMKN
ncbi:uncharacterized protein PHALS_07351 [Plasmopara halstedii]|uniref:Uncharacterized protein n=1 Tax=Plasmopara halstedii TaxID=4781 RepID=A0A0N7L8D8_PLAHL|nr:uncharacterized protein PHALS_07351 [Plasmopara halstedii]CEG49595.1 hypothetical protein PHALS_07351 [Plasmopara halstedii]|eukprot:XP_024585964.1 hypothetical protein PHALS_07351 [Plasmopara halstedii]